MWLRPVAAGNDIDHPQHHHETGQGKAERQKLFDTLESMFRADLPMLVLYNGSDIAAYSDRLEGYKSWMADQPRLWGVKVKG